MTNYKGEVIYKNKRLNRNYIIALFLGYMASIEDSGIHWRQVCSTDEQFAIFEFAYRECTRFKDIEGFINSMWEQAKNINRETKTLYILWGASEILLDKQSMNSKELIDYFEQKEAALNEVLNKIQIVVNKPKKMLQKR